MNDRMLSQEIKKSSSHIFGRRTLARLAAVQALYQITFEKNLAIRVIQQFSEREDLPLLEGEGIPSFKSMDQELFRILVEGASTQEEDLKQLILPHLPREWQWDRIDPVIQMILYLGAYELFSCIQTPSAVIISEYLNVTHAFYEGEESSFINGVLDKIAKVVREK